MRPLVDLGIAQRSGGGWFVRRDVLRAVEEFERLRKRTGFEGDLFEFITAVFKNTQEVVKRKTAVEVIAEEHGVSSSAVLELLETLLDEIVWKTEEDLKKLTEDIKEGRIVFIADRVKERFVAGNREEIDHLMKDKGMTEDEAFVFLLNNFLSFVPVSCSIWRDAEKVAGAGKLERWLRDKVAEDGHGKLYELVPVPKEIYDSAVKEVEKLPEEDRERFREKIIKYLTSALDKVRKEARERRIRKKAG